MPRFFSPFLLIFLCDGVSASLNREGSFVAVRCVRKWPGVGRTALGGAPGHEIRKDALSSFTRITILIILDDIFLMRGCCYSLEIMGNRCVGSVNEAFVRLRRLQDFNCRVHRAYVTVNLIHFLTKAVQWRWHEGRTCLSHAHALSQPEFPWFECPACRRWHLLSSPTTIWLRLLSHKSFTFFCWLSH